MSSNQMGRMAFQGPPDNRALQNQPTSSAELSEESGDVDEPPDDRLGLVNARLLDAKSGAQFKKSAAYGPRNQPSLLTQILHSESDSHPEDDELIRSDTHRTQSSASTYSRGSVVSMGELTSDGGHVTPPTSTPSPPLPPPKYHLPPVFNTKSFDPVTTPRIVRVDSIPTVDPVKQEPVKQEPEKKVEAGLGRKRCITFACVSKKETKSTEAPVVEQKLPEKRVSCLKFACPTRESAAQPKSKTRLASPAPRSRQLSPPKTETKKRGSDATIQQPSPKVTKKSSVTLRSRRDTDASDSSRPEATRFHEFASSEEEVDDWTQEQSCFQRRLTIEDTLAIENDLRRLAQEVEEEENDEDVDQDEVEEEDDDELARSTGSGWASSDAGFQSDDEHGFAHSDDDEEEDPEFDWWGPGAAKESPEFIRPGLKIQRSDSVSSTDSVRPLDPYKARKKTKPVDVDRPELPDSTDFVCGTLDEDKPLERAYMIHLESRRAAKHRVIPQDFDPTFPTSDPELDEEDEEDEVDQAEGSDALDAHESDHPSMFLHGQMDLGDEPMERHPRRLIPKKRSPLGSPKRLRSPPPAKRISLHKSPPRHHGQKVRGRSPAPIYRSRAPRLSTSLPRKHHQSSAVRYKEFASAEASANVSDDENECMTPRLVNRGAIDIVMGLEMKRQRRKEKMYEKHCKLKAQKEKSEQLKAQLAAAGVLEKKKGKGAEKMREIVTGGKKSKTSLVPAFAIPDKSEADEMDTSRTPVQNGIYVPTGMVAQNENGIGTADVHMMSY